jgi:hypothetical protein
MTDASQDFDGAAAQAAAQGARAFGDASAKAAAFNPEAARTLKDASDKALALGQDAFTRQLAAWQAIWTARTPAELVRAQVAFGSESLETYLALTQRSSQLMFDLLGSATSAAADGSKPGAAGSRQAR